VKLCKHSKISLLFFVLSIGVSAQWYQQNSGTNSNLQSVFFINENTGWSCGTDGVIIKTTSGGENWFEQNSTTSEDLREIQFVDENFGWAHQYNLILSTTNGGTTWAAQNFPPPSYVVALFFIDLNIGWLTYQDSDTANIAKITDGGASWMIQVQSRNEYYEAIYFTDENYGWIANNSFGVLKTTDSGNNWIPYSANIAGSPMCIRFADRQTGWISSNTLGSYDISKSTDGGMTWFNQKFASGEYIHSISCPNDSTVYTAGFKLFLPPNPYEEFILKTIDGGATWNEQYTGNGKLNSIFFINDTTGWAVGDSGKILFTENGGVTSVNEYLINPVEFSLYQNFPNPFNPVTKIKFEIPGQARNDNTLVTLKIYDILGREVATLVNEEKPAGEYEVEFDGNGLPSGIYFYQLKTGQYSETKKMVLLK
jgi:photosystem II stability/assembly factor-like uncharacterized protein